MLFYNHVHKVQKRTPLVIKVFLKKKNHFLKTQEYLTMNDAK